MGDHAAQAEAYEKAARIADLLLRDGLPLLGFDQIDMGASLAFAFQLSGERAKYAVRIKTEDATAEAVTALYEAVK